MRRLAIGDVHGNFPALESALQNAGYNPDRDQLFFVGDYIDRHTYSREVVDLILQLPNTVCIRGNHDQFMTDFIGQPGPQRTISPVWEQNGGRKTLESYGLEIFKPRNDRTMVSGEIPGDHIRFFKSLKSHHVTEDDVAIVHGGFDLQLMDMSANFVIWDRLMWKVAIEEHARGHITYPCFKEFQKIFVGHTNLLNFPGQQECIPQKKLNVWNIDTGAGFTGPLTIMDMDTEEYWQSAI